VAPPLAAKAISPPGNEAVDILLVDDQPARLITYEAILRPLGHRLVTAGSGVEALERLMSGEFAVILLDVSMPGMDGFETAELIHQHPRFEGTPIIFVTGVHLSELDRLKGYELGAVDYVYVPVVPQILRSKVQVLVELHRQRLELKRLNASLERANAELDAAHQKLQRETASELATLNRNLGSANAGLEAANRALTAEVEERRRAEEALIEADRRKDEFLAILGHELRNPLAPIRNAIELLQRRDTDDPTVARMREVIDRQVRHLTRLVDDLLEISRITRGKISLKNEPLDLGSLVRRAVEANEPAHADRKLDITVRVPPEPVSVNGDAVRLTQVVGNLVSNAVKYTPDGGRIEVSVTSAGSVATVSVRDTGIGIAREHLVHVFELFGQVRNPRPHGHDGLGIGLALAERLVELHDGGIEALSDGENRGSEFIVRLPLLPAGAASATAQAAAAFADLDGLSGHRMLVVDDHPDCRESLAAFLQFAGNEVRCAADGPSALEEAAAFAPEIVLLDIRMPNMDGYEVARRLRAEPLSKDAILIALTGWGLQEHREKSRLAGFDAHLTKPLEFDVLAKLVSTMLAARQAAASTAA
jgi:signal transduction histidine kinase